MSTQLPNKQEFIDAISQRFVAIDYQLSVVASKAETSKVSTSRAIHVLDQYDEN